jgi:hypothetical protein
MFLALLLVEHHIKFYFVIKGMVNCKVLTSKKLLIVHEWRRSYDIPPPNGESLEMCAERAVAYFKDQVRILFGHC